jgi:hypothetical protein
MEWSCQSSHQDVSTTSGDTMRRHYHLRQHPEGGPQLTACAATWACAGRCRCRPKVVTAECPAADAAGGSSEGPAIRRPSTVEGWAGSRPGGAARTSGAGARRPRWRAGCSRRVTVTARRNAPAPGGSKIVSSRRAMSGHGRSIPRSTSPPRPAAPELASRSALP